ALLGRLLLLHLLRLVFERLGSLVLLRLSLFGVALLKGLLGLLHRLLCLLCLLLLRLLRLLALLPLLFLGLLLRLLRLLVGLLLLQLAGQLFGRLGGLLQRLLRLGRRLGLFERLLRLGHLLGGLLRLLRRILGIHALQLTSQFLLLVGRLLCLLLLSLLLLR